MFTLEGEILKVVLPEGKSQKELVDETKVEIKTIENQMYGKNIKINGRITTGMSIVLGHSLAHACKSVAVFDPKENSYIVCISH